MKKFELFEREQAEVRRLDIQGYEQNSNEMCLQYRRRNSFGLDPNMPIHRIFQKDYYDHDVANGCLTFPRATANVWGDTLENPLEDVYETDPVTRLPVHLGATVSSFYALCWTHRAAPQESDWASFAHGQEAVRISTTVGKLMERMMRPTDKYYMHRSWLIRVEYSDPAIIKAMKSPKEVWDRLESTGVQVATAAAIVRTAFSDEDEVRLLFDFSIQPPMPGVEYVADRSLVRVPFSWSGFVDQLVSR